mgnify:CR=1 FL=1
MRIEIVNKIDAEAEAVSAALKKANRYIPTADEIQIYCSLRSHTGWLEYGIQIKFENGSQLYLAMIQRRIDAEFEFHS